MTSTLPDVRLILDAASHLTVNEGFETVTLDSIAAHSGVAVRDIEELFGSLPEVLVAMLNREFAAMYTFIVDHIERDPRGGLLSRIYYYILCGVYERPLAKVLYTVDREALNSIMRAANSFGYVPGVSIRADFIESMQAAGMVRRDADATMVSHVLTTFSAGLALNAPYEDLDPVVRGISELLARGVDCDVVDTEPGKRAFYEWATTLAGA